MAQRRGVYTLALVIEINFLEGPFVCALCACVLKIGLNRGGIWFIRLLGGHFFLDGAKRLNVSLCKLGNGARHRAGLKVFFSEYYGKPSCPIGIFLICKALAMGVP